MCDAQKGFAAFRGNGGSKKRAMSTTVFSRAKEMFSRCASRVERL